MRIGEMWCGERFDRRGSWGCPSDRSSPCKTGGKNSGLIGAGTEGCGEGGRGRIQIGQSVGAGWRGLCWWEH